MTFSTMHSASVCSISVSYICVGCPLSNSIKSLPRQVSWNGNVFEWGTRDVAGIYWVFTDSLKAWNENTKNPVEFLGKEGMSKHKNWMKGLRTFTTQKEQKNTISFQGKW